MTRTYHTTRVTTVNASRDEETTATFVRRPRRRATRAGSFDLIAQQNGFVAIDAVVPEQLALALAALFAAFNHFA